MDNNVLKNLIEWSKGNKTPPYFLYISLTRKCNLNCLMCSRRNLKPDKINPPNKLTKNEIMDIIDQAADLGVKKVDIGCLGEPFCVPEKTMAAIRKTKEKNLIGWIVTNGTLLTDDILKELVSIKWDHIFFSLHGSNAKTHDDIVCKEGAFEKITKNIKQLSKYKTKSDSIYPKINVGFVLTNRNFDKIKDTLKLCNEIGVDIFIIQPMVIHNKNGKSLALNKENKKELMNNLDEIIDLAKRYNIDNNFNELTDIIIDRGEDVPNIIKSSLNKVEGNDFFSIPCFSPWLKIYITVDGAVHPCSVLWNEKGEDIRKKSLKEIWYGEFFKKFRSTMENNNLLERCKACCATLALDMSIIPRRLLENCSD